jgi:hypothetical protein
MQGHKLFAVHVPSEAQVSTSIHVILIGIEKSGMPETTIQTWFHDQGSGRKKIALIALRFSKNRFNSPRSTFPN